MKARNTTNTNTNTNTERQRLEPITVTGFTLNRVRDNGNGVPYFDLTLNGVTVYGVAVRATQAGEAFIAWPTKKGSDGKFYKLAYAPLSQEDQDKIIQAVYDKLDGKA